MKRNTLQRSPRRAFYSIVSVVLIGVLATGILLGYEKLKSVWRTQFFITDMASQVAITEGKMVKADVLAENFALRPGANLAQIDFAAHRHKILERIPNIRTIRVVRRMPDRVEIMTEERSPVARISPRGSKGASGRVVDTDGVVFTWQRGTSTLPLIRTAPVPAMTPGKKINGRARAALRLVERAQDGEFLELGLLEVDTTKPDYLLATLGGYSTAKIAWQDMDEDTPRSRKALTRQLSHLVAAMRTNLATGTTVWNATDSTGRIYADMKGEMP